MTLSFSSYLIVLPLVFLAGLHIEELLGKGGVGSGEKALLPGFHLNGDSGAGKRIVNFLCLKRREAQA